METTGREQGAPGRLFTLGSDRRREPQSTAAPFQSSRSRAGNEIFWALGGLVQPSLATTSFKPCHSDLHPPRGGVFVGRQASLFSPACPKVVRLRHPAPHRQAMTRRTLGEMPSPRLPRKAVHGPPSRSSPPRQFSAVHLPLLLPFPGDGGPACDGDVAGGSLAGKLSSDASSTFSSAVDVPSALRGILCFFACSLITLSSIVRLARPARTFRNSKSIAPAAQLRRSQRATSPNDGRLPYISSPVR